MRHDETLALLIAKQALSAPYRQTGCLTTRQLEGWLASRGIGLKWETVHHLWAVGLLRPVAVRQDAIISTPNLVAGGRFVDVELGMGDRFAVDLGLEVSESDLVAPPVELPDQLREGLFWHPFQVWQFEQLAASLSIRIDRDAVVRGEDAFLSLAQFFVRWVRSRIVALANDEHESSLLRALALLLAVDPLVHVDVYGRHTYDVTKEETREGYVSWVTAQDGATLLGAAGLSAEEAEEWHERLALRGRAHDPFGPFRAAIRQANRDQRDRLKDAALLAQDLYDVAEVLRCYLGRYHGRMLTEEVKVGGWTQGVRTRPDEFRDLVRRLGLDAQERVHWFIEGATEEAYVESWASEMGVDLRATGIVVFSTEGTGYFNTRLFRERLEHCRREQIFAYVSVDEDPEHSPPEPHAGVRPGEPTHLRELRNYEEQRLLPIGFTVWRPDFVTANFTLDELAEIATNAATEEGAAVTITGVEIATATEFYSDGRRRPNSQSVERAIASLWRGKAGLHELGKGFQWGRALARWAIDHPRLDGPRPDHLFLNDDARPFTQLILMLMRGKRSHYDLSVEQHARGKDRTTES